MFYSIFCFMSVSNRAKKPQSESDLFNDLLKRLKKVTEKIEKAYSWACSEIEHLVGSF